MNKRALLLNSDWSPISFVDEEEAIYLLYLNKAEMISMTDGTLSKWPVGHGLVDGREFPAGATLRLLSHVKQSWKVPRYRRRVLFHRDNWSCMYCGCKLTLSSATVDHIIPASRGGKTNWINCVTSCYSCNRRKRNRTPEEANMTLLHQPVIPSPMHFLDIKPTSELHPDWNYFLNIG